MLSSTLSCSVHRSKNVESLSARSGFRAGSLIENRLDLLGPQWGVGHDRSSTARHLRHAR